MVKKIISYFVFILVGFTSLANALPDLETDFKRLNLDIVKDLKPGKVGRDYVIDGTKGDDVRGDGTILNPWKTISRAFDYYAKRPAPGDVIRIKAGVYRERLFIRNCGTKENPIMIGPFGNGEVIIDCSSEIKGWDLYKDKIYKANCSFVPTAVVVDERPCFPEFSLDKLKEFEWYYDVKEKIIYLCLDKGSSPASRDIGVLSNDGYQDGVLINDAHYITLYGLTVKYAGGRGISILGNYIIIKKCNVKFNGGIGINIFTYNKTQSFNTEILNNNIYHNFMRNWPRGRYKWGGWGGGIISHGTPNIQLKGNIVHNNGGEGIVTHGGQGGSAILDNIVYDNWSVNIYIDHQPNSVIENNLIFCNEPEPRDLYNNGDDNPNDGKNLRRLRAEGMMTADESSPATFKNAKITKNIIINCRRGITHYGKGQGSGLKDVFVANNTIIVPDAKGQGEEYIGINVPYNNGNNVNTVYSNNIIYASHSKTRLLSMETPLSLGVGNFGGVIFKNNIWYHDNNTRPFHIGPQWLDLYDFDFFSWQKVCKDKCSGDIYQKPDLKDLPDIKAITERYNN